MFDEGNSKLLPGRLKWLGLCFRAINFVTILSKDDTETFVYIRCQRRTQKDGLNCTIEGIMSTYS